MQFLAQGEQGRSKYNEMEKPRIMFASQAEKQYRIWIHDISELFKVEQQTFSLLTFTIKLLQR